MLEAIASVQKPNVSGLEYRRLFFPHAERSTKCAEIKLGMHFHSVSILIVVHVALPNNCQGVTRLALLSFASIKRNYHDIRTACFIWCENSIGIFDIPV